MTKTLVLYKGKEVVKQEPASPSGKTTLTLTGLNPDTDYVKGTYQIAWRENDQESSKIDVPAFRTEHYGVQSISVDNGDVTLNVGDTKQVVTTVKPNDVSNKKVTYTTNNEPVATVSETGVITGVKSGNATITVKSDDNNEAVAKVKVAVQDAPTEEEEEDIPTEEDEAEEEAEA